MRRSENGTRNTDRRASNRACRPRVEVMEDRRLLAVFVVGNANDGGPGSFRDAIDRANLFPDRDVIEFQIDSGPQTIELGSALAPINFPVLIAGSTQPGFDPTDPRPIVEIRGPGLDRRLDGLVIEADDTEVRSLVINNFGGNGILVGAESPAPPANVVIVNNFIGTDPDGDDTGSDVTGLGNGGNGVEIRAAIGLRIEGNVISGNFLSGVVDAGVETLLIGNIIGLGVSGSILVPNGQHGVVLNGPRATVGGVTPEARNVISGNNQDGIQIGFNSNSNVVEGNFIGVNRNGRNLRGNGTGIHIISTRGDNRIGGTTPGARNVISGNFGDGISIENSSPNNVISGNYIGLNFDGAGTSSGCDRASAKDFGGNRTILGPREPSVPMTTVRKA